MKPYIDLLIDEGVHPLIAKRVRRACRLLRKHIDHTIVVHVLPGVHVIDQHGKEKAGFFFAPEPDAKMPRIWLADTPIKLKPGETATVSEQARRVLWVLCHEMGHYDQWRLGLEIREAGIGPRTLGWSRKLKCDRR